MCWTTRHGTGRSRGRAGSRSCRALGPPVEQPMASSSALGPARPPRRATAWGGGTGAGRPGAEKGGKAPAEAPPGWPGGTGRALRKRGLRASLRTFSCSSCWICRMLALARLVSLGMKSRAPRARASRVAWAPSWVRLDTISTARGISAMIRLRQPRPSRRGISTSRVTMSGSSWRILSRASRPSRAGPPPGCPGPGACAPGPSS